RGEAAAGWAEQHRVGAGLAQALRAERDLVVAQTRRQLVERRHLRVVVAVVADRHPGAQLSPDQLGVLVGEVTDAEEGSAHVQPLERCEDAPRVLARGAVVEGKRDRPLYP